MQEQTPQPGAEGGEGAAGEHGASPASIVKDYVRYLGPCPPSPRCLPAPPRARSCSALTATGCRPTATGCNPQNPAFTLEQMGSLLPVTTGIQVALPGRMDRGGSGQEPRRRSRAAASREKPVADVSQARGASCPARPGPAHARAPWAVTLCLHFHDCRDVGQRRGHQRRGR